MTKLVDNRIDTPSVDTNRVASRAGRWLISIGAAITCGIALFVVCTWWWWRDWRIGAGSNTLPMSPATALILMILGGALLLRQRWGGGAAVCLIGFVAAGIAAVPAVIMGLQHVTGVELAWEHWLPRTEDTVRGIPVGHMSPLSAGAFLFAAVSLAALLPPLAKYRLLHRAGLVTASLGAALSIVVILAYASGALLFYSESAIRMSMLTAVGLAALNLALLTAAVSGVRRRAEGAGAPHLHAAPLWRGKEWKLLVVIGVLAFGIALTGLVFLRVQQAALRERIADELGAIADLKVSQIVNWRNEWQEDARLMQTPLLARSAATFLANPDSAARGEILAFIGSMQRSRHYEAVVLFDNRMNPRMAVPSAAETSSPRLRALLEAVPRASDVLTSDLHRGVNGDIHLDMIVPIRDLLARPTGRNPDSPQSAASPVGAMLLRINPRDFLYPLIEKWPVPSKTGETLLVRREGDEVVFLNDLLHQPGAALTLRRSIRDLQLPAAMGTRGLFGVTEGVDYRGVRVLAAVRAVPGSPWILVAKQDETEIYAPLHQQAWTVSATLMALLLGAALAATYLWRQITATFLRRELAAETARSALAERLALVTQHANDVILLMDETRRIVEANDRALRTYGYTLDELRQLPPGGLWSTAAIDDLHQQLDLFGSADGAVFETVHQRKDGTIFPVEASVRSIEVGGHHFSLGIYRDITERKQAERELLESHGMLQRVINNIPQHVFWKDLNLYYLGANTVFARSGGLEKPEDIIGKSDSDLTWKESADAYQADDRAVIESGVPKLNYEESQERLDGSLRWLRTSKIPLPDDAGKIIGVLGIYEDITERKLNERQLIEQNEIIRNAHEGLMIVNQADEVSLWSRGAEQIFGWTAAEALGRQPEQLLGTEYLGAMAGLRAAIERDGFWNGEMRSQTRDGRKLALDFRVTLVRDEAGQPRARLNFIADITERKLTEEKFLHAQQLESIGMLSAGIAHDLNNVLAPILFAAPMLRTNLTSPADRKLMDTLERCAQRGVGLVRQILGFARSTAGEFGPTQVKHLVNDVIGVIEQTFPKAIQLEHQIPSDLWPALGNATQIHQVLLNLCVNARDAMAQGGTLRIAATNRQVDAKGFGAVPGTQLGAWLEIDVSDTGTGIPPEVLEHIWTPFFTTKGVGKGTGLGLSTIRSIIANHHGFVDLQTVVGQGSTFRIFLPAVVGAAYRPSNASPSEIPGGHGELILVVDDDAPIRDTLTNILERNGYSVLSCVDGMEAIILFNAHPRAISLVVTDVDMPRLGGVGLAGALLQIRPDIRLLAISGLSSGEGSSPDAAAIQKLVHAFLVKPFTAEVLLGTVHELLFAKKVQP